MDPILNGLQAGIDRDRAGWNVTNYVCVVGISRINDEGQIETSAGVYYADGQPDYTTKGLLNKGYDLIVDAECAADGTGE
jgi:hypothetical protein